MTKFEKIKLSSLFMGVTALLLLPPAVYTAFKLGWFYQEPVLDVEVVADENAPVMRIVADKGFKPRAYLNKDGQSAGSDVAVAIEAAKRLGMRTVVTHANWLECRELLATGQADVLLGLEIFSNMQGVIKTIPVSHDRLVVYGRTAVLDAAALAGKRVALMGRSVLMANYELNCRYVEYYTNKEILQAVVKGEADYAICHELVADNIIKDEGYRLKNGLTLAESFPAFGVQENNILLRQELNRVLAEMAEDGKLQSILQKWLTTPVNTTLPEVLEHNMRPYLTYLIFALVVEGVLGLWLYSLQRRAEKERELQRQLEQQRLYAVQGLELENARTKLVLSQIKPHFIYNTLSTIAYLCTKKPALAKELVLEFATYLRGNLRALDRNSLVPFAVELEHLQNYLKIEKLRFMDALQVEYDIQATDFQLPVLTVEPLVENAVKHGVCQKESGGTISLRTRELPDCYQIIVEDDGAGFDLRNFAMTDKNHVGLRSVKKRLELLCQGTLTISSTVGQGTRAVLTLPKDVDTEERENENLCH